MASTLKQRIRVEIDPVKGSRFIATAAPVSSEASARTLLDELRAQTPDATHHCSAWRIARPAIERANDDGEPSGSAGRPILSQLVGRDVLDACIIVTRHFGGTKLGVGGLVRAYAAAAAAALDAGELVEHLQTCQAVIEHGYEDGTAIERALTAHGATTDDLVFGGHVTRRITVPRRALAALDQALRDATAGRIGVSQTECRNEPG